MIEIEPVDWEARLAASVEKKVRAQDEKRETRRGFDARRDAGLQRRYAAKLARLDAAAVIPDPDGKCHYIVDDAVPTRCPNGAVPSSTLCRPHLVAAANLARRLGLLPDGA